MLTAMKLTGNPAQLAAYHTHEENYYFKQSGVADILRDTGLNVIIQDPLDYVTAHGNLCAEFGLADGQTVSEETFLNLLSGKDAAGVQRARKHKVIGIDLTFSAPKTVSVAGLVTARDPELIRAHDRAVIATMREIEKYHSYARPTARSRWSTGSMLYVTVRDGFSREHDPHLHTHVVVCNMTKFQDKIMGLWTREIFSQDFNRLWGSVYRTHLAAALHELGYAITYTKGGEWRLDAVSHQAESVFSTRRHQIVAAEAAGKRAMDAWRKTRKQKDAGIDKTGIVRQWRDRAKSATRSSAAENRIETVQARASWAQEAAWSVEARQERAGGRGDAGETDRWQLALRRATERTAAVSRQLLVTEYLAERMRAESWQAVTFEEAARRLDHQVEAGHIVRLENERYTSWEMAKVDREYMTAAGKALKGWERVSSTQALLEVEKTQQNAKERGYRALSAVQTTAVCRVISSNTLLTVVQGDAGSGKTTALRAVAEYYQARGVEVIGLAMQGVAARNLEEETGIRSTTLASFLNSTGTASPQTHKTTNPQTVEPVPTVVVFDEASMLDSRNAAQLFRLAEQQDRKLVLVGDRNQLESIAAGRVFDRLVSDAERAGDLIVLNENFRQRDDELRQAVDLARNGRMGESLAVLERRGALEEIPDAAERRARLAVLYNRDTLIITSTGAARDDINLRIRRNLVAAGRLVARKSVMYTVARTDDEGVEHDRSIELAPGDVITFTRNEYTALDVRNGERGTVLKNGLDALSVALEDGRTVKVDLTTYRHIDHGYCLTTYKAQGQTYDRVVVDSDTAVPSLVDMRNQYVNVTRARDDIRIYTDDIGYLKELAEIKTHARDTLDCPITLDDVSGAEAKLRESTARRPENGRDNDTGSLRAYDR